MESSVQVPSLVQPASHSPTRSRFNQQKSCKSGRTSCCGSSRTAPPAPSWPKIARGAVYTSCLCNFSAKNFFVFLLCFLCCGCAVPRNGTSSWASLSICVAAAVPRFSSFINFHSRKAEFLPFLCRHHHDSPTPVAEMLKCSLYFIHNSTAKHE